MKNIFSKSGFTTIYFDDDKRDYMSWLFLAEEQEEMIEKYQDKGTMYVLDDDGIKGDCVVTNDAMDVFDAQSFFLQWHETVVKTDYRRCGFLCENS